jgi:hypothetical protein
LVVADVSGNGTISSFDAAEVAKYVIGMPPFGSSGNWIFSPINRVYPSVTSSFSGQDYSALLMGEVSGNWLDNGGRVNDGAEKSATVRMPALVTADNDRFVVPIFVDNAANKNIISYEFDLRYDPSVMRPQKDPVALAGTASRGFFVVSNIETPGILKVAAYGPMPLNEDGVLLNLKFELIKHTDSGMPLVWQRLMLNEADVTNTAMAGEVRLSPPIHATED